MKKWLYPVLSFILLNGVVIAADSGLALLKVNHGARQSGMASAVVAQSDEVNLSAYNPAALVNLKKFTASFGHTAYWENVRIESGYFGMNFSDKLIWHGGIRFAVLDELEKRLTPSYYPDTYFDYHDISFKTGLSYRITSKLSAGFAAGWFLEKIDVWSGSAFNVDFGLLYQATPALSLGASATNIGSDFTLTSSGQIGSDPISLPTTYTAGFAYRYDKYLGEIDMVIVDDEFHLHLGAEGHIYDQLTLRSGYMVNYDSKNFTAGASFEIYEITIDYGFLPFSNDLGTAHMFTITRAI